MRIGNLIITTKDEQRKMCLRAISIMLNSLASYQPEYKFDNDPRPVAAFEFVSYMVLADHAKQIALDSANHAVRGAGAKDVMRDFACTNVIEQE